MSRRVALAGALVVLALLLALGARDFLGPSAVPAGQRPLLRLTPASYGDFVAAFDADPAAARLVLLLSPT